MKILTGFLTHIWIVGDEWVFASCKANTFLLESDFGGVRTEKHWKPLNNKKFLLHSSFTSVMEEKVPLAVELIRLGGN
jgi:hypothetical protein